MIWKVVRFGNICNILVMDHTQNTCIRQENQIMT